MNALEIISQKGTDAVKRLRERKLKSGFPFMIDAEELDTSECYLEYPDGTIKIASIAGTTQGFRIVRELSETETVQFRERFHLDPLA